MFLLILIAGVVGYFFVKSYNKMQTLAQDVHKWKSNIRAALERYVDSVNKLQELAKGYMDYEKPLFIHVSDNLNETANAVNKAMASIHGIAQAYPELKANTNFLEIMAEVREIQKNIQNCKGHYNDAAAAYNSEVKALPQALYASKFGFPEAPYYDPERVQEVRAFTTDDGAIVRDMLKKGTKSAVNLAKSAADNLNQAIDDVQKKAAEKSTEPAPEKAPKSATNQTQTQPAEPKELPPTEEGKKK